MNIKSKLKRTDKISGQSRIYRRLLAGILALALLWTICPAVQGMAAETSQPLELYVQDAAMSEDGLKIMSVRIYGAVRQSCRRNSLV